MLSWKHIYRKYVVESVVSLYIDLLHFIIQEYNSVSSCIHANMKSFLKLWQMKHYLALCVNHIDFLMRNKAQNFFCSPGHICSWKQHPGLLLWHECKLATFAVFLCLSNSHRHTVFYLSWFLIFFYQGQLTEMSYVSKVETHFLTHSYFIYLI